MTKGEDDVEWVSGAMVGCDGTTTTTITTTTDTTATLAKCCEGEVCVEHCDLGDHYLLPCHPCQPHHLASVQPTKRPRVLGTIGGTGLDNSNTINITTNILTSITSSTHMAQGATLLLSITLNSRLR